MDQKLKTRIDVVRAKLAGTPFVRGTLLSLLSELLADAVANGPAILAFIQELETLLGIIPPPQK
jgi:hypothetical protein